eukprot:438812-Pyramimonas_sp.AAC.1
MAVGSSECSVIARMDVASLNEHEFLDIPRDPRDEDNDIVNHLIAKYHVENEDVANNELVGVEEHGSPTIECEPDDDERAAALDAQESCVDTSLAQENVVMHQPSLADAEQVGGPDDDGQEEGRKREGRERSRSRLRTAVGEETAAGGDQKGGGDGMEDGGDEGLGSGGGGSSSAGPDGGQDNVVAFPIALKDTPFASTFTRVVASRSLNLGAGLSKQQVPIVVCWKWHRDGAGAQTVCKLHSVQKKESAIDDEVAGYVNMIHNGYPSAVQSFAYPIMGIYMNVESMSGILRNMQPNGRSPPESVPVMISVPRKM